MNTKTNPQHVTNSYNGDTIGRDSPSALLEVLAEVASQTLHSEKKHIDSLLTSQCKAKTAYIKRKESCFTVPQLLSMPVSHLIKHFAIFTSDELKRQYSYTCALVPGCQQKYTSFASEEKATVFIKNHLAEHLEYLKADRNTYDTFIARGINHKSLRTNLQKKSRVQTKKPQETLNKENKNVISEKSTYLRKILLNDINIKENEKQKCFQKSENKDSSELKNSEQMDIKVLGDHSYYERLDDKVSNKKGASSSLNNALNNTGEESIVLMVVGSDSIHMKEYSHVNQKLAENINCQDSNTLHLSGSDEIQVKNMEMSTTTKPKGKAKFIGTSKEEREMALAFMERIKKKGNPTGSNLQCRICDPPRSFTAPTTLVSHYRSHAGIKPYECTICSAVFTRTHSLKYHMLIHQNQTRFTCTDCGKKFRHPSHYKEHQRRHTGEAPFGCDDCGQRFKTRNTYKRHLKTRHGKILTTVGEVLRLSEEDFQKVRTNRRKKDCTPEITMNIDSASNAIVDCISHDETQIITNSMEEYVLKENIDDINRNWGTKRTIQFVDKCLESFQICSESQLNKTDGVETEIAVDGRYDRDDSNINVECINSVENDFLQLKNPFYDDTKVTNNIENHIVYQHNIEDENKFYDCNNEIQYEYSEVNETLKDVDITANKIDVEISKEQDESNLHLLQRATHDYHKIIYSNDVQLETERSETTNSYKNNQTHDEKYDARLITTQNGAIYEKSNKYADNFNIESKKCVENNVAQITDANINILQTFDEIGEVIIPHQNNMQENKYVSESVTSKDSIGANQKTDQQQNQYLYICAESLNKTTQNKCINIPLHQINFCHDQNLLQTRIDNCNNIRVLNGDVRTIDVKQFDKQNTILLLSNGNLKNGIFQIDRNNIIIKTLKS